MGECFLWTTDKGFQEKTKVSSVKLKYLLNTIAKMMTLELWILLWMKVMPNNVLEAQMGSHISTNISTAMNLEFFFLGKTSLRDSYFLCETLWIIFNQSIWAC